MLENRQITDVVTEGEPLSVPVGDAKQLDAVDAGKPLAQLQQAGMPKRTARP